MKLSQIKTILKTATAVNFRLPDDSFVPEHFHVTEIGLVNKHFIDCGGVMRTEKKVNFQLWDANDYEHRLKPQKLLHIIDLSEKKLGTDDDSDIEVEYQGQTIGKYGLDFTGEDFVLTSLHTACLAQEQCGVPQAKKKLTLAELQTSSSCCTPGGGCC